MAEAENFYPWNPPQPSLRPRVAVKNSLTGNKVPFVPRDGGNKVSWYICGPTVYDSAHIGHASNYVRFDIVRRLLEDYFGYDVVVQMNVTDIDDKIIQRANERNVPFESLARQYETEFMEDMDLLNIRRPHFVTRVSEYIPEVVEYTTKIIENGFAYESCGSVYFDTTSFVDAGHSYGKLEPWSVGNKALVAEGEGELTVTDDSVASQKKAPGDFALWKKSKDGEPSWDSPWGPGRPGWHIECSAMASHELGSVIDIHAGGVDLRFPHHSNEIAQAEAYHGTDQWINYFLHAGHLHIEGYKMSKSLKNFITIREGLEQFNARQMRLVFLSHRYDAPMNYSERAMEEAVNLDRSFIDFFGNLKAAIREVTQNRSEALTLRPNDMERELFVELSRRQDTIHNFLSDNFETPGSLLEIQNLIRSTNAYIAKAGSSCNGMLLQSVGRYVSKILRVFGLLDKSSEDISYGDVAHETQSTRESIIAPLLDIFSSFRDSIRKVARTSASEATREILRLCDFVRDEGLPPQGVRLEDRGNEQAAVWKLEDPQSLVKEMERKREAESQKRMEKERLKLEREARRRAEMEKGRITPEDMFRTGNYKGKFSAFDNRGVPTKDNTGKELSKSALKVLLKARSKQENLHAKYQAGNGG